jgi:hypothetical protein
MRIAVQISPYSNGGSVPDWTWSDWLNSSRARRRPLYGAHR